MKNLNDYYVGLNVDNDTRTFSITARSQSHNAHYKVNNGVAQGPNHLPLAVVVDCLSENAARYEKQNLIEMYRRAGYTRISQES